MSLILNQDTFGEKLYNRLPNIYRTEDENNSYALKRYIESLSEGGFSKTIEELNGLLNIVDPEKTPSKVLRFLFGQYGVTAYQGVEEKLLRKMLQMISDIMARKGSESTISFIASLITGSKPIISYSIEGNSYMLKISFEVEDAESAIDNNTKTFLESVLRNYVPFYWDMTFESYVGYNNEVGFLSINTDYFDSVSVVDKDSEKALLDVTDNLI